ncbi:hypothetical protein SCHPADRAFT_943763 [Schizopora paradoxa]|uniref:VWFA domain-containing protein n=1 Tax=Schizopora paradoxa TaxID=27342 RepID=A0A0H2RIJ3_9AGAM|nr:hypothetical protein SCHPADRAFT_943763 [Schizopora paradoxa]
MHEKLWKVKCDIRRECSAKTKVTVKGYRPSKESNRHLVVVESEEITSISVQPGDKNDLVVIMKILSKYQVEFRVVRDDSILSTVSGVQIRMSLFNHVVYTEAEQLVEIGAGCTATLGAVYSQLANTGQNFVAGVTSNTVGVLDYVLNGGYSLKSNIHGLGFSTISEVEMVMPNGDIVLVKERPIAGAKALIELKKSGNDVGVVTRLGLKSHKQGVVWGGVFKFDGECDDIWRVKDAIGDFAENEKRREASLITTFRTCFYDGDPAILVLCVYDGAKPDLDPWKPFEVEIDALEDPDNSRWTRELHGVEYKINEIALIDRYTEVDAMASELTSVRQFCTSENNSLRGRVGCIMVHRYNRDLIDAVASAVENSMADLKVKANGGKLILMNVWPFQPSVFEDKKPTFWPRLPSFALGGPLIAYFVWDSTKNDSFWIQKMQTVLNNVLKVAIAQDCSTESISTFSETWLAPLTPGEIYRGDFDELVLRAVRQRFDATVGEDSGLFKIPELEDELGVLAEYDVVFVVDDSRSMKKYGRWDAAQAALGEIVQVSSSSGAKGKSIPHHLELQQVESLFDKVKPSGETPTATKLEKLLGDYIEKVEKANSSKRNPVKPVDFIVITDGKPTDDDKNLEDVIVSAAKRLKLKQSTSEMRQVGIQFVQIGDDPEATEHLERLDTELSKNNDIPDIVDTVPYRSGQTFGPELLLKAILGGIKKSFDEKDEKILPKPNMTLHSVYYLLVTARLAYVLG